ncbi:MAG: iron-containing alcohol dehydrogenase [Cyanobacteria bacterium SZAS TMP-1]|nr:iron-containing alcohol dehydrogenase [Cyanobacteria bacterium SZAS TMP-1]
MNPFVFTSPTKVRFGEEGLSSCGDYVQELGGTKVLIVTDAFIAKSGKLAPLIASIKSCLGVEPLVFSDVPPDSDVSCVDKGASIARENNCDCIVAIGGGSVMDTAKVINICLSLGGDLLDHQGINNITRRLHPLIAIPTTSGTGSEVSFVAMVKDHQEHKKMMFGSPFLAPDVAILDPLLIVSLPAKLTAATGIDAVTHCIECFVAQGTNSPMTDSLCLEALRLLKDWLAIATADGADLEARSATLVASTMAGMAFTNSGVGVVHALAHAIGGKYGTHHGMTNGVLLPHGMRFNLPAAEQAFARLARYTQVSEDPQDTKAAEALIDWVCGLLDELDLPVNLKQLGVPELNNDSLSELADLASSDPAIMFNPREVTSEDLVAILRGAY